MKIVIDENIPLGAEVFGALGEVIAKPGRTLQPADVADADALIVRSVTSVDAELLTGSKVRFVGTCTIGVDHLDTDYLEQQGIAWANAPGCNADSVVEYVLSALATQKTDWLSACFGIIGCGNVGGRLYERLNHLGVACRVYDPFLTIEQTPDLASLEDVLTCDVVSIHAPLTTQGDFPSLRQLGQTELKQLPQGCTLISAGRGAVVDNQALKTVLAERSDITAVLDVWEPEPLLDIELLDRVQLGSPHIAGYSYDGKLAGTAMVFDALCRHLKRDSDMDISALAPAIDTAVFIDQSATQEAINQAVLQVYDVRNDDRRLREALANQTEKERALAFDVLRKNYPERRSFARYSVCFGDTLTDEEKKSHSKTLATVGFKF